MPAFRPPITRAPVNGSIAIRAPSEAAKRRAAHAHWPWLNRETQGFEPFD